MEARINEFVSTVANKITIQLVKNFRKVSIVLLVISLCLLLTIKSYVLAISILAFCLIELLVYTSVIKKKIITIYNALTVSLIFSLDFMLSCNLWLYFIQIILECYNSITFIITVLIELICLLAGYLYATNSIKQGRGLNKRSAAAPLTFSILPGALGYCLSRRIIEKTTLFTQSVFFSIVFISVGCILMFAIGMYYVSSIYYIKKYHIANSITPIKKADYD
ncbi:MAG: hypothetical protein IJD70_10325 [Clostridia bacterium]|nr:hypothetical protein [Clostridia bacterium]